MQHADRFDFDRLRASISKIKTLFQKKMCVESIAGMEHDAGGGGPAALYLDLYPYVPM